MKVDIFFVSCDDDRPNKFVFVPEKFKILTLDFVIFQDRGRYYSRLARVQYPSYKLLVVEVVTCVVCNFSCTS